MDDIAITVTVDDANVTDIDRVAAELQRKGMHVDQVLPAVGAITGSVQSDRREDLKTVPGVESIEDSTPFQLPPPDSLIQ